MQAFYRAAWVQGQYRPVRPGVFCAAVRCGVHVLARTATHGRGRVFGLYLNRDAGILSGGVGARPVLACTCRPLCTARRCGVHVLARTATNGRGRAFGLYLNRDAGILSGGVGARPVLACTCRRLLCGGALWGGHAKHASREHSGCI
jgi:hypothetical protein